MNTFIVEMVVTEECNLACKYCYMKNIKSSNMTKETFDKFLETIPIVMKKYECSKYHVSFFGGEPLINWDLIEYAIPKLNLDKNLESQVIITNGLLLDDDKINFMKSHNTGFSLSFDGLWNKDIRPLVNGKSSLDQYKRKKDLFKKHNVNGCKVMISPQSLSTLTENFKFFIEEMEIFHPDFTLVRDDIWSKDDIELYEKQIKKLADTYIDYINNGISCSTGLFELYALDIIYGKKFGKRPFGCFAGVNGCGYMSDGIYYPCSRFGSERKFPIYDSNNRLMYHANIGILKRPSNTNPRENLICKKCEIYKYCNSGCTYSQLKDNPETIVESIPIESVCELFKLTYEQVIRISEILKNNKLYQSMLKYRINSKHI